jgi:hypothetical protein
MNNTKRRQWLMTWGWLAGVIGLLIMPVVAQQGQTPDATAAITATPETVIVPDVSGLAVPLARAELNRAGLRLGTVTPVAWSAEAGDRNTVSAQTPAADASVPPGSGVQVDVLRDFNIVLRYNRTRLTMLNRSGQRLTIDQVRFTGEGSGDDSAAPPQMPASRWSTFLREQQCVQVWSSPTDSFVQPPMCQYIQGGGWFVADDARNHFWFGEDSDAVFHVVQDGLRRATCPVATDSEFITCDVYIAPGTVSADTTEYAYFVYDMHNLYLVNRSETDWMPLQQMRLNVDIDPASRRLYADGPLDNPGFLAPGQCLRLRDGTPDDERAAPLSDCFVIGTATLDTDAIFWRDGFQLNSQILGEPRDCPSVPDNQRTLCLLPR